MLKSQTNSKSQSGKRATPLQRYPNGSGCAPHLDIEFLDLRGIWDLRI
jgi:hypothetical protein